MGLRILIIDDSATTRLVVKKSLQLSGVEVQRIYEAASGLEALATLRAHPVDLVFSDLNMPQMSGEALLIQMSQEPAMTRIPVIVVSTEGSKTRLARLPRPPMAAFLRKPFTPELFKRTVTAALSAASAESGEPSQQAPQAESKLANTGARA